MKEGTRPAASYESREFFVSIKARKKGIDSADPDGVGEENVLGSDNKGAISPEKNR